MSLANLKQQRKNQFEKLTKLVEETKNSGGSNKDDGKYWSPTVDKAGNGYAVVRFMPAPEGEDAPFIRLWSHGFKGPTGKWYIENSRTTLNEPDPVSELNSELWNKSEDDNSPERKQARAQKRRLTYVSNVLVVKDPANPENEGKVFLFKYGKKIWDKIQGAMYPEFADETGFNPFDLWDGANFKIKIRQVEGYRNYDKSEFEAPAAVSNDDDELEVIYKKLYPLQALVAADQFRSYDELKSKLHAVLGMDPRAQGGQRAPRPAAGNSRNDDDEGGYTPPSNARRAAAPSAADDDDGSSVPWSESKTPASDEAGDDFAFFEQLAKG